MVHVVLMDNICPKLKFKNNTIIIPALNRQKNKNTQPGGRGGETTFLKKKKECNSNSGLHEGRTI